MKTITPSEFQQICASGRPDDEKFGYPSMVYHPDDTITKIWANPVKLFSSAIIKPYAKRFVDNAALLKSHGIPTPEILDHFKIKNTHVHIVQYQTLPGHSIRELLETAPGKLDIPSLANFILTLHQQGIEFRTIHLGNVIQMPDNTYGLIDFCDITTRNKPLTPARRAVNLATPLKYANDMALIKKSGLPDLKESYLKAWSPDPSAEKTFLTHLAKRLNRFKS